MRKCTQRQSARRPRECGSRYDFGHARALYARGQHPRIVLGPADLPILRRQTRAGIGCPIMEALRRKVGLVVQEVLACADMHTMIRGDGSHNSLAARVGFAINDIALVAALDGTADTVAALRRLFATVSDPSCRKSWVQPVGLALAYDLLVPHLTEDERVAYRRAALADIRRRVDEARPHYLKHPAGNICLGTTLAALPAILALSGEPGVPDQAEDLRYLLTCFEATLRTAIHQDGYPEEDMGYGTGVATWLIELGEWLRRAGIWVLYTQCPHVLGFGRAILHFVQPWGENLSNTGDHGDDIGHREFVLARLAAETRDPALLWLLGTLSYSHGTIHPENMLPDFYVEVPLRKGFRTHASFRSLLVLDELRGRSPAGAPARPSSRARPAHPGAFCDRTRGLVSFRSGWRDDDALVLFDGSQRSPAGQGHAHASCGHFSLSAVGEYFAIDTGRYNNEQSCHNVLLVDDRSGRSTDGEWSAVKHHGRLTRYAPGAFVDFAAVDSSHQHAVYWAWRSLGFVKGPGARPYAWVVDDLNVRDDWASHTWQLHTSPENTIRIDGTSATVRGWRHGNLMDVHFALPAPQDYPKPHTLALAQDLAIPNAFKYLDIDPRRPVETAARHVSRYARPADMVHGPVYLRPRLLARLDGYNGRMMAVLLPRLKGEPPAAVTRLESLQNTLAVRVVFAEVEDVVVFAFEHQMLQAEGIDERGSWCVVRRSRTSGRLLAKAIG